VRPVEADEIGTWLEVIWTALQNGTPDPELVDLYPSFTDLGRCLAAVDADGQLCGTARAFATELTVPGGATIPAAAVSSVGVLPTHRRQGHLTRLMHDQLADVVERREPVAYLVAAEYPIYGRFGYGPAVEACVVDLDTVGTGGWRRPPAGRTELVDGETLAPLLIELYDRARLRSPGHITWDKNRWEVVAGARPWPDGEDERRRRARRVVWRDADGLVQGAAIYDVDERWEHNRPRNVLTASLLVAATDEAQRELVRYLASVDWVRTVRLWLRPVDDPVSLWVDDGRAALTSDHSDHTWLRILDVPTTLEARRYAHEGRLVLELTDPLGYAAGRFALEAGPDGATCRPTTDEADVVAPVTALGAAYLGGFTWTRLHAAGWLDENRPGGVARATALFATGRAPHCPMTF
jgi:predicted acetyltransferase